MKPSLTDAHARSWIGQELRLPQPGALYTGHDSRKEHLASNSDPGRFRGYSTTAAPAHPVEAVPLVIAIVAVRFALVLRIPLLD